MAWNEQEYDALIQRLETKHADMFSKPYGGVATGPGWWPIIESLCGSISHYLKWRNRDEQLVEPVRVVQIKEKFGGLRFYYEGGDERIRGMVEMAEAWAGYTCEECGVPGQLRHGGWIRTLCDHHEAERQEQYKRHHLI